METEIKKKLESIQKQLNEVMDMINGKKQDPLSINFNKAINRTTSDDQYIESLRVLKNLPFKLSVKQFSWVVATAKYHPNVGESIVSFIKNQLSRVDDEEEFIDNVSNTLRKHYTNDNNADYIESLIETLKEMKNEI